MRPVFSRPAIAAALLLFLLPCACAAQTALTRTNLLQFLDSKGKLHRVSNLSDWRCRKAAILDTMQEVMGPLPGPEKRCALYVQIEEEVDCGEYLRRFITYQSEANSRVPAYLLIPKSALQGNRRVSGILCLH